MSERARLDGIAVAIRFEVARRCKCKRDDITVTFTPRTDHATYHASISISGELAAMSIVDDLTRGRAAEVKAVAEAVWMEFRDANPDLFDVNERREIVKQVQTEAARKMGDDELAAKLRLLRGKP